MSIETAIWNLEAMGLVDVILPFIIIFTVLYVGLAKVHLFGKEKRIRTMLALALAAGVIVPHVLQTYPPCWDVVEIINTALPNVVMIGIAIVSFMMVAAIVGFNINSASTFLGWAVIVIFGFVTYTFLTSGGQGCYHGSMQALPISWLEYILPILVFAVIIWFVTRGGGGGGRDGDIY
ncbi:hypothetical protein H8D36_05400 [archaeon]|nr:hypothetical protein [archaeon]MBL7057341.1 hypothetical protein [Candidatus Woesearchaeota archaeon]